jgi:hypothetical protein
MDGGSKTSTEWQRSKAVSEAITKITAAELACAFYTRFASRFADGAVTGQLGFTIQPGDFDLFLVEHALLPAIADDYPTGSIERAGITAHRTAWRHKINRVAHTAESHTPFHIDAPRLIKGVESRATIMRIKFLPVYVREAPKEQMHGFGSASPFYGRAAYRLQRLAASRPDISSEDKAATGSDQPLYPTCRADVAVVCNSVTQLG